MKALAAESHILFVTHKYPPSTGGMQKQSFELINNIKGYSPVETIIFNNKYPIFFFMIFAFPWVVIKLLRNPKINVIHSNDTLMALFLTPCLLFRKKKLAVTVHGLDIVFRSKPYQWWVRKFLSKFHLLIAVSRETRQECIDRGIHQDRIIFIPNAIALPKNEEQDLGFISVLERKISKSLSGKKIILSVGRPIPRKGFSWFAEHVVPNLQSSSVYIIVGAALKQKQAFSILQKILPKTIFRLWCQMNGVPMDYIQLEKLLKNQKINNYFALAGKLSDSDLAQIYLHSDLFVMPNQHVESDFEGFGLVALEAGVRGVPCLASAVDGIPSAVYDGVNGYLLPERNATKWIEKIDNLLKNPDLAVIGQKFKDAILEENYTWTKMAERYKEKFDNLIA